MIILTKIENGERTELGRFEDKNSDDAVSFMIKDFLKEANVRNIPEHITEDWVCNEENLEELIADYEYGSEYGWNDGEGNSWFFSKGFTDYYWYFSHEK